MLKIYLVSILLYSFLFTLPEKFLAFLAGGVDLKWYKNDLFDEKNLHDFFKHDYEPKALKIFNNLVNTEWEHSIDLNNKEKQHAKLNATLEARRFDKENWENYFQFLVPENYQDVVIRRQITMGKELGSAVLDEEKFIQFSNIKSEMVNVYSTAKICPYENMHCDLEKEGLNLDPEIEDKMRMSSNYDELLFMWRAWRDVTGRKMKHQYESYVKLSNEVAKANNFSDKGAMWRNKFESFTFENDLDKLWNEVKPLYVELHKYVLRKLKIHYGERLDVSDGLIPAHVLGNMWGQSWINIRNLVKPFGNAIEIDATGALRRQGYTPLRMFQAADEFYQSLGLESTKMSYNVTAGAVIEKPTNRDVICHASAWDFHNGKDFRIKMCTKITFEDFVTIHHEMGHIQYYMLYKNQPLLLRNGANPGFHEAVGDTIALSVSTTKHLKKLDLITDEELSKSSHLNTLMDMALERVAFLPFSLLVDKWRWDVFSGKIPRERWNSHWWFYRTTMQGIKPPIDRSDGDDFDPGSKFHIPADTQYISYFVAHILEFQLHRGLCITSGQYDPKKPSGSPLNLCDIYGSKSAGDRLRAGLSLGASRHWKIALKEITGEEELSGSALMEYFQPLYKFLLAENHQ